VPKDREERRNTGNDKGGNDKGGNEQYYSSFESIKTSKLFKKNNTQSVYEHCEVMHFKQFDLTFRTLQDTFSKSKQ